jgi:hypothetical protein
VTFHERGFSVPTGRFIWGSSTSMASSCSTLTRTTSSRWQRSRQCVRVLGDKCPLAPLSVLLHVRVLEGRLQGGGYRLRQPLDEARSG